MSRFPLDGADSEGLVGEMMNYPLVLTAVLNRMKQVVSNRSMISKTSSGAIHHSTYGNCYQRICQLASALQKMGLNKGDRVGTLAWNGPEHFELYFGVPCLGAVIHTLNLRLSSEQLSYIIRHAEDRFVFVDYTLVPLLEKIASDLTSVEKYIIIGAPADFKTSLHPIVHYEAFLDLNLKEYNWPDIKEEWAAGLCYTSGTTGNPKGVLYSHRSQMLHMMAVCMVDNLGLHSGDRVLPVVPMFHANAWGLPYAAVWAGSELVFPGPFLKPQDLGLLIQNFQVTIAAGVPSLWIGLFHEIKKNKYDLKKLRMLVVGGAAMPRALIEGFEKELKIPVLHAWGMTELSPLGTSSGLLESRSDFSPSQRWDRKAKQGVVSPGLEIRIVDDEGKILPWDDSTFGHLQAKGAWVAASYFRDPSGSSQFTSDGWFQTGDVATIDSSGCVTIVDRSKDLIKSGGEWISSVALENALLFHSEVLEAAVISIPDMQWGERPLALIVPKGNSTPPIEDLKSALNQKFAKFWIPEKFIFVKELPKTSVGKIDKKRIREQYAFS